ncbi:MAG: protein kinase [Ktedonobacteraceae bacterium]|nr:protein kinase [Ktedonobacteraceae bacterium]
MIPSSFCDTCGAALTTAVTTCPVCGQAAQAPPRAYFAQTMPKPNKPPMHRHSVLMQRYRILEKIGEGGFGHVYKALDKKNNMIVAIKQINVAALSMQEMIDATDAYNREITLLPKLQHRRLPRLYGYFTDEDHWYIIMQYIDGETLEETLAKADGGRLPLQQVLDIGIELCDVLGYLHAQQPSVIYRDIKPSNIMVKSKSDIYLIDFGTARRYRVDQSRDTGSLGSPGYAAPEQYGKKAQTIPRTDMYGLGATLQTLLTGKEPLEIATGGIPPDCDIPTELQRLIRHMMSKDVYKRPQNMQIVQQALTYTKKRHLGKARWFVSSFTWLATLWIFFMFLIGNAFLPPVSPYTLSIWSFYFVIAAGIIVIMSIHHFYKEKRITVDKLTIKEIRQIVNEGLSRPLYSVFGLLIIGCTYSLIPLLFRFQIPYMVALVGFFVVTSGVMFAILKGLPRLFKWLKQKRVIRQAQQSTPIPPLKQYMH